MRLLQLFERAPDVAENPDFQRWFGDSKVVDSNNNPLQVYHGADAAFSKFQEPHDGIYFSNDPSVASEYGLVGSDTGQTYPAYLSFQNPLIVDYTKYATDFKDEMDAAYVPNDNDSNYTKPEFDPSLFIGEVVDGILSTARDFGRDGVIMHNIRDGWESNSNIATTYIAFNPNQIKSVFNRGTYDDTDNISESSLGSGFDNWFGNSAVIDDNGEPLVAYHGTTSDFDRFNPWSHFGTAQSANDRTDSIFYHGEQGNRLMPVYLSIQNPLTIGDHGLDSIQSFTKAIFKSGAFNRKERNVIKRELEQNPSYDVLENAVRDKGYDGFSYTNAAEDAGSTSYVIFHPSQVKSIFNKGSYSSDSDHISEATREYQEKLVDPALMTFQEYRNVADPDHKSHPTNAYDSDLKSLNSYAKASEYPELLNTITAHGLEFEIRKKTDDRWDGKYTKTTPAGDIVRGENGLALMMSREEVSMMIPEDRRYHTDFAIVEKETQKIIGNTQDEWGTLLVVVAREYQKFGFGTTLVKLARSDNPTRQSGGFTNAGMNNFARVHDQMVREYMSSGFYSHLVKTKQITMERVKAITSGIAPRKQHAQKNLNTADPAEWLLMSDGQSYAVLYDRKLLELDDVDDENTRLWVDKHIIGMATIGSYGNDHSPWINRTYGSDKIKGFLIASLMQMEVGESIRMEDDELKLAQNHLGTDAVKKKESDEPWPITGYYVESDDGMWKQMAKVEQKYRKKHDPYQEWYARILEWAESISEKEDRDAKAQEEKEKRAIRY